MGNTKNTETLFYKIDKNKCFFCETNSPDEEASLNLPLYRIEKEFSANSEVKKLQNGAKEIFYTTKSINIPRCEACKQEHKLQRKKRSKTTYLLTALLTAFFLLFLFLINPFVNLESGERVLDASFLSIVGYTIVVVIFSSLIAIPISSAIAGSRGYKVHQTKGIKPLKYFNDIYDLKNALENGYKFGTHPPLKISNFSEKSSKKSDGEK